MILNIKKNVKRHSTEEQIYMCGTLMTIINKSNINISCTGDIIEEMTEQKLTKPDTIRCKSFKSKPI